MPIRSVAPFGKPDRLGWLIAAPQSGAGKTTVTLGLLRALRRQGVPVRPYKAGPDYIDPTFHALAAGAPCRNLDLWAMPVERVHSLAAGEGALIVEGAMGLFDGAANGTGSAADLAKLLDLRVALVVDAGRMSGSVAALVHGFRTYDPALRFGGVILNRVASDRHERMLRATLGNCPVLGVVRRDAALARPERHLGLVPAGEQDGIEPFVERAANAVEGWADRFAAWDARDAAPCARLEPLGQRVAVARDTAFAFLYPHVLDDWRAGGAEIAFFSPLADEPPAADSDAVFLPGGYPELHAGALAAAERFKDGLRAAAARGAVVYGECGGYMVLGDGLVDRSGGRHAMAGLLPAETSFERPTLHLGYRSVRVRDGRLMGAERLRGHEFHHARVLREGEGEPLFDAWDAEGNALAPQGRRVGSVMGSWMHVVDRAP